MQAGSRQTSSQKTSNPKSVAFGVASLILHINRRQDLYSSTRATQSFGSSIFAHEGPPWPPPTERAAIIGPATARNGEHMAQAPENTGEVCHDFRNLSKMAVSCHPFQIRINCRSAGVFHHV
jgi:hypothetical protein